MHTINTIKLNPIVICYLGLALFSGCAKNTTTIPGQEQEYSRGEQKSQPLLIKELDREVYRIILALSLIHI